MTKVNYHMHTTRCKHAKGSDEDYVLEAIKNGYTSIGFSDHCVWKYDTECHSKIRMELDEFPNYKESILYLKEKYKDQIEILFGMEVEYFPKYMDWMKQFIIDQDLDYVIFGNHFYQSEELNIYYGNCDLDYVDSYFDMCIEGLKTGIYSYLAHPELIMRNRYLTWNDAIEKRFADVCKVAKELDIPLEYNLLGLQYNVMNRCECYPHHKFWELTHKIGNKVIIGMDAHQPSDLSNELYNYAYDDLKSMGIEPIQSIELKKWEK